MSSPLGLPHFSGNSLRVFPTMVCLLLVLVSVTGFGPVAWAQKDTGSVVGTVRDPSGAVVPEVKVTVTDVDRGITFVTATSASGDYVASPLHIGRYNVRVEKEGFKTAIAGPIELQVQQRVEVNVTLEVGQTLQTVEVKEVTPLLETQTSELGQVVDTQRMVTLPLNGRNFAQLAFLSAGIAPTEPGARNESSYGFSSNGGRSYQNNFLLDGIDNNSNLTDLLNGTSFVVQPSVDALQEFKVQTNAYSAEFGRGNGAILNATIKSGTNQFHGVGYEFLRNDKLDARNFFDAARGAYQQNQFGGTIGGPIRLGRLYDGRNRSFFFFDYEGLRVRQARTLTATVPTPAEQVGDFSSLLDMSSPTGVLDCGGHMTYAGEIFDVRQAGTASGTPTGQCGVPFGYDVAGNPLNVIPTTAMDPLAAKLRSLWPAPNISGAGYNFLSTPKRTEDRNNFDARVDHKFSDKDTSFYRISYEKQPSTIPSVFQATGGNGVDFATGNEVNFYLGSALSETHIFTPRLVNEFRFGYNRVNSHRYQFNYNQDVSATLGIPGVPYAPLNGGMPEMDVSGVDSIGDPTYLPSLEIQNTFSLNDNLTWIRGRHSLKFGGEFKHEEFTIFQPAEPRGQLGFEPLFTDNAGAPGSGGAGLASFLVGLPDSGAITNLHNVDYVRPDFSFYVQDDFKVSSRLTLNLGVRYDLFMPVMEKYNAEGTFDLATGTLYVPKGQTAQLTPIIQSIVPISATAPRGLVPVNKTNIAPRIGFAYKAADKLVLRGGYGIFFAGYETGPWSNPSPAFNPPFFVTESFTVPCPSPSANPAAGQLDCRIPRLNNFSNGFPSDALSNPNTPQLLGLDPHIRTPYMQQWHLSAQYELPFDTMLEIGYGGSKGTKLYTFFDGNEPTPTTDSTAAYAPRRPVPVIDSSISVFSSAGNSSYNSLQARAEKRFSHGVSLIASYTWGHSLDNESAANLGSNNNSGPRFFRADPGWERGNSDFDIRQRFVLGYIWELPFGRGKRFGPGTGSALNQVMGGWQVSGITTISSGNWLTITDGNGNFSNSTGGQRPDLVSGQSANGKPCVAGTFFNTCAFTDPPLGSFGNAGRNIVQGPGFQVWDMSLLKVFPIREKSRVEFRAEFFNLPNHTNFTPSCAYCASPLDMASGSYGFTTSAKSPRQIQFGLKFYY
jgi:hypothetical protein